MTAGRPWGHSTLDNGRLVLHCIIVLTEYSVIWSRDCTGLQELRESVGYLKQDTDGIDARLYLNTSCRYGIEHDDQFLGATWAWFAIPRTDQYLQDVVEFAQVKRRRGHCVAVDVSDLVRLLFRVEWGEH